MEKKPPTYTHHPKTALKSAIATLEQFARKTESEETTSLTNLIVQEGKLVFVEPSSLKKVIGFIASIFSSKAREKYRKQKKQVQNAIQEAIDTIKRNYLVLEKLKAGNVEEQQLAISTYEIIKRYNEALAGHSRKNPDWSMRIAQFLYPKSDLTGNEELETSPIDLPMPRVIPVEEEPQDSFFSPSFSSAPVSTHETDIIRMKANTLLRQHGIKFKSAGEAVSSVKGAQIHASLNPHAKMSTLCLTLNVLPGTTIKVRGSFKKESAALSAPISDSFHLTVKSTHTGFPHPIQNHGWALHDVLMPYYPHRLEQLTLFKPLYEKKKKIAESLLLNGPLLEKAKKLFLCKSSTFEKFAIDFLAKHQELCHSIVSAGSTALLHEQEQAVENFFQLCREHQTAIPFLLETYGLINQHFLVAPYAKLQEVWMERNDPLLLHADPGVVSEAAVEILKKEVTLSLAKFSGATAVDSFIRCLGTLIGYGGVSIISQGWSETFGSAPPMLNDFQQKIQTVVYIQLLSFFEELDWNFEENTPCNEEFMWKRTIKQLDFDIALFRASSFETIDHPAASLVNELEDYFNTRFLNRK